MRNHSIKTFGVVLALLGLAARAVADTLTYTEDTEPKVIRDALVVSERDDRVEYLTVDKGRCVALHTLYTG